MSIVNVLAGIPVANHERAVAWYARFFDRPADATPMPGLAEWHCAPSGGVQVFRDEEHAGGATLTLGVADIDAFIAALASRGITAGDVSDGAVSRFASVTDPEGNTIILAELYADGAGATQNGEDAATEEIEERG